MHARHYTTHNLPPPTATNLARTLQKSTVAQVTQSGGYLRRQSSAAAGPQSFLGGGSQAPQVTQSNGGTKQQLIILTPRQKSSNALKRPSQQLLTTKSQESGGVNCDTTQQSTGSAQAAASTSHTVGRAKPKENSNNRNNQNKITLTTSRGAKDIIKVNASATLQQDSLKSLITQVTRGGGGGEQSKERKKNANFSKLQSKVNSPRIGTAPSIHQKQSQGWVHKLRINHAKPLLGPQLPKDQGKKTLVLDLDETLVHSSFKPHDLKEADILLPVELDGNVCLVYVLLRPGALEFCQRLSHHYEVVIFTASLSKYADPLVKILDPEGAWCSHILFREHCTYLEDQESYVKDMALLGRDLKDIIILDNSPTSYLFQPENALASRSWYDDFTDRELYDFIPLLANLSKVDDVRPFLSRIALQASDSVGRDIIVNVAGAMKILGVNVSQDSITEGTLWKTIITSSSQGDLVVAMKPSKSASFSGGTQPKRELSSSAKRYLEVAKNLAAIQLSKPSILRVVEQDEKLRQNQNAASQAYRTIQEQAVSQRSEMESIIESSCRSTPGPHMTDDIESKFTVSPSQHIVKETQKTKLITELSHSTISSQYSHDVLKELQMQLEKHRTSQPRSNASINLSAVIRNNRGLMGSYDQRMATTGNGPVAVAGDAVDQVQRPPKKIHLNIAARAIRPIVMSNSDQVSNLENQAPMKKPQTQQLHSLLSEHTPIRSVLVPPDNTRDFLESNCDIPREDNFIQRMPSHFQTQHANPRSQDSSSSINRTPKSEIRQPGQLFEKSGTRGASQNKTSSTATANITLQNQAAYHPCSRIMMDQTSTTITSNRQRDDQLQLTKIQNVKKATDYMLRIAHNGKVMQQADKIL